MNLIRPQRLQPGDTIGIVAPASGVAAYVPRRFERGVDELKKMGFEVIVGRHARKVHAHMSAPIEERLEDLQEMFRNQQVKGIITTIGGFSSHQLLDELDFDLIRNNPKVFMGYSDITALQWAITVKTGLVTFLGPAILPQFGEFGGLTPYNREYIERTLLRADPVGRITDSPDWADETLMWDQEDDRPRTRKPNEGTKVLKEGTAAGRIFAGNLSTLMLLAGTPYFPDLTGAILCVEEEVDETQARIDRFFIQLRHLGVYDKIAGLLIGRFHSSVFAEASGPNTLEEIVRVATRGYDFPIAYNADFGHYDPMFVLPNGIRAELTASLQEGATFAITEAAVL
jgi:muramoyltetrapeptide carboxypeptidase